MLFSIHHVLIETKAFFFYFIFFFSVLIYCRSRIAESLHKRIEQKMEMTDNKDKIYIVSYEVKKKRTEVQANVIL